MRERDDTGFMCMIDFECELYNASGGSKVYSSIEDLKANHDCWESCGIVEVRVEYVRTIVEQDLNKNLERIEE